MKSQINDGSEEMTAIFKVVKIIYLFFGSLFIRNSPIVRDLRFLVNIVTDFVKYEGILGENMPLNCERACKRRKDGAKGRRESMQEGRRRRAFWRVPCLLTSKEMRGKNMGRKSSSLPHFV